VRFIDYSTHVTVSVGDTRMVLGGEVRASELPELLAALRDVLKGKRAESAH
jgi:hypothetical protein